MPTTTADPNSSSWLSNPVAAGNTQDAANWFKNQGYQWTPAGWQMPSGYQGASQFPGFSPSSGITPYSGISGYSTGSNYGTPTSYPNRTLPPWLSPMSKVTGELESQYAGVPAAFNTGPYMQAVERGIGAISTTARNAASNAAAEYANKVRQAGGTSAGAGLIKAQGLVGAEKTVGEARTAAQQFALEQREKQATLSSQIADQLGTLRNTYLNTLTGYATSEDRFQAQFGAGAGSGAGGGGGGAGGRTGWSGVINTNNFGQIQPSSMMINAGTGQLSRPNTVGGTWSGGFAPGIFSPSG